MTRLIAFFALFCTSVMFVMSSGNPALARIDDAIPFIYKHKIATIHPCGNPNTDLNNLTGFFKYRWKATYTDLTPEEVQETQSSVSWDYPRGKPPGGPPAPPPPPICGAIC